MIWLGVIGSLFYSSGMARANDVGRAVQRELTRLREGTPQVAAAAPLGGVVVPTAKAVEEARLLYYLAQTQPELPTETRSAWYEEGRAKAQQARDRDPNQAGAIFWWAANEGGFAQLHKSLSSLSAIARLEKVLIQLRADHPDYGYAAANRMLAAIYIAAPAVISIGSYSKAEAALQDAVRRFPEFPGNQIGWIEYLKARGRDEEAQAAARALIKSGTLKRGYGEFEYDRLHWEAELAQILPTEEVKPASPAPRAPH